MTAAWERVPNHVKVNTVGVVLVLVCMAAAFGGGLLAHAPTISHIVKVERSWGTPTQSVDGAQVSESLAGLRCDVYQARKTVVCHP